MSVVFYRIDDRLIHGQVMTGWSKVYNAKRIIVVDDATAANSFLCQVMALDRQNAAVAGFDDPRHEAVLRLIALAAKNAHAAGIWIGICGELGADESLLPAFLDMGIDELSVTPTAILPLRAKIASLSRNGDLPEG